MRKWNHELERVREIWFCSHFIHFLRISLCFFLLHTFSIKIEIIITFMSFCDFVMSPLPSSKLNSSTLLDTYTPPWHFLFCSNMSHLRSYSFIILFYYIFTCKTKCRFWWCFDDVNVFPTRNDRKGTKEKHFLSLLRKNGHSCHCSFSFGTFFTLFSKKFIVSQYQLYGNMFAVVAHFIL